MRDGGDDAERPRRVRSAHAEQLDLEQQRRARRDDARGAAIAVAEPRRDQQRALAAGLHAFEALVPAFDDGALAEGEGEGFAGGGGGVELGAVGGEVAGVLDGEGVAVGGGGLISGVATALKALAPRVRVIGIEAEGSPVLLRSLEAGRNIALERVTTAVATMACAHSDDRIFELVRDRVDAIVLVSDAEMLAAANWLWFEMGLAADLSGAAAIAALREGRVTTVPGERVCAIVCGAGPNAILG